MSLLKLTSKGMESERRIRGIENSHLNGMAISFVNDKMEDIKWAS